jgi:hypothetical protein
VWDTGSDLLAGRFPTHRVETNVDNRQSAQAGIITRGSPYALSDNTLEQRD